MEQLNDAQKVEEKRVGDAEKVADKLDVTVSRVYDLARQNLIPGVIRLGRTIRFDLTKIDQHIEEGGAALPGGWRREKADQ